MESILALSFNLIWSSGKPCDSEGNILQDETPPPDRIPESASQEFVEYHPTVNGRPCDKDGFILPDGTPPPPFLHGPPDDFTPFDDCPSFELADLLYRRNQMPASQINNLLQIWCANACNGSESVPFANANDLYRTIDATTIGNVPWQSFTVSFNGDLGEGEPPAWKTAEYEVFFRNPLTDRQGKHRYMDFMSGNWAWKQVDRISEELNLTDITFCPVIAGSDKTTVSVATGQNEYYPVYASNGLIHNNVRRAHRDGVSLLAFLSIPKTDREHHDSPEFRNFHRQLFHGSLHEIFQSLHAGMETPEVIRYGDGHYRRTIFGLGPYIADYPKQALLACIVQEWCARCTASHHHLDGPGGHRTHEHTLACFRAMSSKEMWDDYGIIDGIMPFTSEFPRADIHELLSPDLLHQIIKGTFKDHLVTWVEDYIKSAHTPQEAAQILADIDRRIAAVPPFPGLRRFPEGRGFKQWTGDDSKALMKVYLPVISGHVPPQMVQALAAFMDFCYHVCWSVIDENDLVKIDAAVAKFHQEQEIFRTVSVRKDEVRNDGTHIDAFSLPRQHALSHYRHLIQEFGAPNGLCSSITKSKHIKAVKEPWRHSSCFEALGQMLLINEWLDKLAAIRVDFKAQRMLANSLFGSEPRLADTSATDTNEDDDGDAVELPDVLAEVKLARMPAKAPRNVMLLAQRLGLPHLPELIWRYLYEQMAGELCLPPEEVELRQCPKYQGKIIVYPSAVSTYYAPSDLLGIKGLHRERIRPARYDCVYCEADGTGDDVKGFRSLHVAHVLLLFSLRHEGKYYECALVTWFSPVSDGPCADTGMWVVEPDTDAQGQHIMSVIHLDCILRAAHLIGVTGQESVPKGLKPGDTLNVFPSFFVNKYIDHHAHEIAF
ncbi:hypothetical protein EDD85DRAFT_921282 [Armillaria nabsnona]|nr:hypothetical protein EDD85DRAFT_921282 [Armillaria nabsnona]